MTFLSSPPRSESADVLQLLDSLEEWWREAAIATGRALVAGARCRADERPYLDEFLQEFGLSNQEGIALMCLAEALLRIPDDDTADRLIAEKIASGNWDSHSGRSSSVFVNASTWGLMLTGRLVDLPVDLTGDTRHWLHGLSQRMTEPVVRNALRRAMRIIGGEFVVGRSIQEALDRCTSEPTLALCSFDMLGEGARTDIDAERYAKAYASAINAITTARGQHDTSSPHSYHSISIKLSALDPRYALMQRRRTLDRLLPRALELARLGAAYGLDLTIDAEEQDRLELSLELFSEIARDPKTRDWPGLGIAVQAYGRRAPQVVDFVTSLAHGLRRPLAVRLVKGAYWDGEIKRAQERGLAEYPVYTRKCSTDVAYLACARKLLAAPLIYPQFATHNAHTIGAILAMSRNASPTGRAAPAFEFQRLHGMGILLYDEARRQLPNFPPVRVYAPVGAHADLLAYLVRRLLENGANTSFVNHFMDKRVSVADVVGDLVGEVRMRFKDAKVAHPGISLPPKLFGDARKNSVGLDFGLEETLQALRKVCDTHPLSPMPAFASVTAVAPALDAALAALPDWQRRGVESRSVCLEGAADLLEQQRDRFLALLVQEAGKTFGDALAEVREAADFCRYYAAQARELQSMPQRLAGPTGETNDLHLVGRGVFACISPWNFPLAIFAGQVAAALVTGNTVVAKPAETTPRIALAFAELLRQAGVLNNALQVLPMIGRDFGDTALEHPALAGIVFTGSTATARWINQKLAARPGAILPLIAETGGINAMIVDSTALPEQVVDDTIASAFGSAGQRCSALRLLCVQDDIADRIIDMLRGAMDTLVVGDPRDLAVDIGPVISLQAVRQIHEHVEEMSLRGRLLHVGRPVNVPSSLGADLIDPRRYVVPHLIELDSACDLSREAFGPILHVIRYAPRELPQLLGKLRASGYALTLGIQSRLESTRERVYALSNAGNVYVNRNMVSAVVGVQPFGGSGLSGTGPKAGGPHYLLRFVTERTLTINTTATGGNTALLSLD
ncbi:MAG: L-glutamate gamma-semialdehyde dehydrogenase [Gammaproteobacteria bacterium]|nr:L-glutamate gamma-semialdehyde dehydrogenase [Gammaproteobacteria bacterium]